MSEHDFLRERDERNEAESFELERMKMRAQPRRRHPLYAEIYPLLDELDAAELRLWRFALLVLLEWRVRR